MVTKEHLLVVLTMVFVLLFTSYVIAAPTVRLDGKQLAFDVPPIIDDGRTLVPLRAIFEAMEANVTWDQSNYSATAVKDDTIVVIKIGSTAPTINGYITQIDVPAKIVNGRTMVPLRFVGEAFDTTVHWDENTQTISIIPNYVRITTTGTRFSPLIELESGSHAVIKWEVEGGATYYGLNPVIDFGAAGTRYVRMSATAGARKAISDIVTFNVGFDHTQDAGRYNLGIEYDYTPQFVSNLQFVNSMTNLRRFLGATPTLVGELDFTGMKNLEYIECFNAGITSIKLTGCNSLIRLSMEYNDLATLDLNPVAGSLCDLRLSGNRSPLTLAPLHSPLTRLYHYCAHSESVINHPTAEQLPVIEEWEDWNSGQTGKLIVRSTTIHALHSQGNQWTAVDLTNQFPLGHWGAVYLQDNQISSVILKGCEGLTYLDFQNNLLNQMAIDGLLTEVESWGTSNCTLIIAGNSQPSAVGEAKKDLLIERGWIVN